MTTKQARKILGRVADSLTDEDLQKDIRVAEVLKNLFFSNSFSRNKVKHMYNRVNYGKT